MSEIVNTKRAAEILGTTPDYVRTLVTRGRLKPIPGGHARGPLLFDVVALEAVKATQATAHPWRARAVAPKRTRGVQ